MSDSITSIRGYINAVRLQLSTSELLSAILKISGYLLPTYFVLLVIESVFYLEPFYRQKIMTIFWVLFGTGYCYHFLRFLKNKNQWFGNRNDEIIARYIGKSHPSFLIESSIPCRLKTKNCMVLMIPPWFSMRLIEWNRNWIQFLLKQFKI